MMIGVKKKGFGMQLNKTKCIALLIIIFLFGVLLGVIINDVPFITFDTDVDLSSVIAIIGLVATIFIMPFVVEAKKDNIAGIRTMAVSDLDTLCGFLNNLKELYERLFSEDDVLTESDYAKILSTFKHISSLISTLSDEFNRRNLLESFSTNIKGDLYQKAYEKCTDSLIEGKKVDKKEIKEGLVEIDNLFNEIKKYRYMLYE